MSFLPLTGAERRFTMGSMRLKGTGFAALLFIVYACFKGDQKIAPFARNIFRCSFIIC